MRFRDVAWTDAEERVLFVEEATELLTTLEQGSLTESPPLDALFRAAHTLKGSGGLLNLADWVAAAHRLEDALDAVRRGDRLFDQDLQQLTLDTVDQLRAELEGREARAAGAEPAAMAPPDAPLIRDSVLTLCWDPACGLPGARALLAWQAVNAQFPGTRSDPGPDAFAEWTGSQSRLFLPPGTDLEAVWPLFQDIPDLLRVETPLAPADSPPNSAPTPASESVPALDGGEALKPAVAASPTIRIGAETLERLLEGLGELLLDQAQLEHRLGPSADTDIRTVLGHLRRRSLELQDLTLRARMLPLDTLFRQYPRAIHDMAQKLKKEIRLDLQGGETELDRLVMDRLHEPLLHLLRNACDHGIEDPQVRQASGKSAAGVIRLASYAAQGHVHVLVTDDGAGIDWEKLRRKAVRRGWLAPDEAAQASEERLAELLFRPGVTTTEVVTELSGRGVGLDAVRAFLDGIHGTITVDSEAGHGTTFHLELPMTMAIMTALLVEAGPWIVGLPILTVERIEETGGAQMGTLLGQPAVPEGDAPLPVYPLSGLLDPDSSAAAEVGGYLVRVHDGRTEAGVTVDAVRGQQEVVVKPVAPLAPVTPWLSGVALLGDGRLALMLDIRRLIPGSGGERDRGADDGILRAGSNQMELLVFRLSDNQRYGINVYKTREVFPTPEITTVPGQHAWLDGFLRLRGQTLPVINLHRALGIAEPETLPLCLITEFNQSVQAFRVDAVERMVRVSWDQVEPLPAVLGAGSDATRRLTGLIDHPEWGPIQLLDFEQILAQIVPTLYPEAPVSPSVSVEGQRVWLADDSGVARRQVEKALEPLGVRVRSFADGQALWEAVESGDALPGIFVLDVEMPRLDGYTLTQKLKQDVRTAGIGIVLHTSLSGHWHAERASLVEADTIVTKFVPERLAAAVVALLKPTPSAPLAVGAAGAPAPEAIGKGETR